MPNLKLLLTHDQRAWLVGFFDAEAAFMLIDGEPRVEIDQKDPEPLTKVMSMVGGSMRYLPRDHPAYRWAARGPRARAIMHRLKRSLSRRRQAQISIALKENR